MLYSWQYVLTFSRSAAGGVTQGCLVILHCRARGSLVPGQQDK